MGVAAVVGRHICSRSANYLPVSADSRHNQPIGNDRLSLGQMITRVRRRSPHQHHAIATRRHNPARREAPIGTP